MVVDEILRRGGDQSTGFFPGCFSDVAENLNISANTVKKIWSKVHTFYNIDCEKRGGDFKSKLNAEDLALIETLKTQKGSISLSEIYAALEEMGDVGGDISISSISRAIKSKMMSGKRYTRKKITHVAAQRFTFDNLLYTQLFIDYLSAKDVSTVKFFDESGIKLPDVGTRLYGHSPVGERCVEVVRKHQSPNTTLNMLVSVRGLEYFNLVDGASNTVDFLNFFEEAANVTNTITLHPTLEVGDTIVMDNLVVHHYEGGEVLEEFLGEMGIELIYTPVYSPDLNPIGMCFNKINTALN